MSGEGMTITIMSILCLICSLCDCCREGGEEVEPDGRRDLGMLVDLGPSATYIITPKGSCSRVLAKFVGREIFCLENLSHRQGVRMLIVNQI